MSGRLGRINVTLYYDELERASGGIWQMLAAGRDGMTETEEAYWVGAAMALDGLRTTIIDGDWQQYVAALKMHIDGSPSVPDENESEE